MKFFVNFLSAFRIAAAFAIIPTLMLNMYWVQHLIGLTDSWHENIMFAQKSVVSWTTLATNY